jgi:cytochrome c biogenesis protein CcdA
MGSDLLLVVGAVVAGVLTTLAPCVLPLLPVVVGGSLGAPTRGPAVEVPGGSLLTRPRARALSGHRRALVVTGSLGLSVIAFTVLLKVSTALIGLPAETWQVLSGGVLLVLGVTQLLPAAWDGLSTRLMLGARAGGRLSQTGSRGGVTGAVLTGAALGPVFSSCSPLYAYLVVTLIPAEPLFGMTLLMAYVGGLCGTLLAVAVLGQRAVRRLRWAADPHGRFRRALGLLLVLVGVLVLTGADRSLQTWLLEHSPWRPWELDAGFVPDS